MNVLIAEDEALAAERLQELLIACEPTINVVETFDNVEDIVTFLNTDVKIDLLVLDIQLADGKSFEIFKRVQIEVPIIFTTAFDQYALQAFKLYSIDYLLKPIQVADLAVALRKYKRMVAPYRILPEQLDAIKNLIVGGSQVFKERFLLKSGNKLTYKSAADIAYFMADGKTVHIVTRKENRKFLIDYTLEELEQMVDPKMFFRINRKIIINIGSIMEVRGKSNAHMEILLSQPSGYQLLISRDRANAFKQWLDN